MGLVLIGIFVTYVVSDHVFLAIHYEEGKPFYREISEKENKFKFADCDEDKKIDLNKIQ